MAELPKLGKHCDYYNCNELDFLPVKCNYCKYTFCKEHFNYDAHNCESWKKVGDNNPNFVSDVPTYRCKFTSCKKVEEMQIICPKCSDNFCMAHRLEQDHECGYKKPDHMPKTANLVSQIVEGHKHNGVDANQRKNPKILTAKAQKTAAKVQLMKLKQNSVGQKSIPTNDRIHFRVHLPLIKVGLKKCSERTRGIFVSKSWCLGKVLDNICDLCGVENKNNVGDDSNQKKVRLFKHSTGELLPIDKYNVLLEEFVKNEDLLSGDTLVLEYIDPNQLKNIENQLDLTKYVI